MSTAELPVFVFASEAIEALDRDSESITEYDARYVVAPFDEFVLRARPHARVRTGFAEQKFEVPFREVHVTCVAPGRLVVVEDVGAGPQELNVSIDDATVRWTATIRGGQRIPTTGQSIWPITADRDCAAVGRIVIGCLLGINHREVQIREGARPTRQERRAADRDGRAPELEHEVMVGRNIVHYAADVARGHHAKQRAAHLVRAHVRRYRSGLVIQVRAHQRGVGPVGAAPIYDATGVGGAI